jgi:hypothetical protein
MLAALLCNLSPKPSAETVESGGFAPSGFTKQKPWIDENDGDVFEIAMVFLDMVGK